MIVRVLLLDKKTNEQFVMLFGNSYKKWYMQFEQYRASQTNLEVIEVLTSRERWIGLFGLKWCPETEIQDFLDKEFCYGTENKLKSPRKYEDMIFRKRRIAENTAKKLSLLYH